MELGVFVLLELSLVELSWDIVCLENRRSMWKIDVAAEGGEEKGREEEGRTGNTHQLLKRNSGTQNHIALSDLSVAATLGLSDYFGSVTGGNDVAARAGGVAAVAARIEGVGVGARGNGEGVGEEEGEEGEGDGGELHFDGLVKGDCCVVVKILEVCCELD
ncbi:hypothetical protein BCON_0061g00340 [Botryotinia convoluta]|uniref:Protein kinase domain-containing protein n=1 Tax=Botryotinia convoluta TaxID=54673 RepID=A0A4Z1I8F0_9HELO|nr:hypothetical protein BCON_0061g00340 [Botryotinia convoluta]